MLLTVSTTHEPATDLGFLAHKNPANVHEVDVGFGRATLPAVRSQGGEALARSLFEPLGYRVTCEPIGLGERFPQWGPGPHHRLEIAGIRSW